MPVPLPVPVRPGMFISLRVITCGDFLTLRACWNEGSANFMHAVPAPGCGLGGVGF